MSGSSSRWVLGDLEAVPAPRARAVYSPQPQMNGTRPRIITLIIRPQLRSFCVFYNVNLPPLLIKIIGVYFQVFPSECTPRYLMVNKFRDLRTAMLWFTVCRSIPLTFILYCITASMTPDGNRLM